MQVREIMSTDLQCCTPGTGLQDAAKMMVDCDCGAIPVVDEQQHPVGIITDRDITTRAIAKGENPLDLKVEDCMSTDVICARPDMDLDEALRLMEERQVRRIPVVDDKGACCGIVAQADIARRAPEHETAELVRDVSKDMH